MSKKKKKILINFSRVTKKKKNLIFFKSLLDLQLPSIIIILFKSEYITLIFIIGQCDHSMYLNTFKSPLSSVTTLIQNQAFVHFLFVHKSIFISQITIHTHKKKFYLYNYKYNIFEEKYVLKRIIKNKIRTRHISHINIMPLCSNLLFFLYIYFLKKNKIMKQWFTYNLSKMF